MTRTTVLDRGNHVLVVGGSSGFGLGVARAVLDRQSRVTIVGRDPARLASARSALAEHACRPDSVSSIVADAHHDEDVARLFDTTGAIDHVVSLVGTPMGGGFLGADLGVIRASVESKFFANLLIARRAAKAIGCGSMTFTAGTGGRPQGAAGSWIGNIAVEAMVEGLAVEAAPFIRVNAVAPTWTPTTLWREVPEVEVRATQASFADRIPLGRTAHEHEVVDAFLFCMTNGFVTGQTIAVDGGVMLTD